MFELKRISSKAIPRALRKAERYRLLNEPREAESICLDVLLVDADNQEALVTLLLAMTDQFIESPGGEMARAKELLARLHGTYEQHYYAGIVYERWAQALLRKAAPAHVALGWIREAMRAYEQAIAESAPGNDDAILRWNACVRIFRREEGRESEHVAVCLTSERDMGDEMPMR